MPKVQKKSRSATCIWRATPLATRDANASKQPPASKKTSKPKKAAEEEQSNVEFREQSKATATSHEASSADSESANNYLVLARLSGSRNPPITRLLSLPPSLTFDKIHRVLQISFGWTDSHTHDFNVSLVTDNYHGVEFLGSRTHLALCPDPSDLYCDLSEATRVESEVTLADVYEKPEWKDKAVIDYEYDHGVSWIHQLALLGRATPGTNAQFGAPDDVKVLCLSGQGHAAAEDAGGVWGWENLKEAFKHPRKGENRERIDWYKSVCRNGGKSLDPYAFDVLDVNDGLRHAFAENRSTEAPLIR